VPDYVYIFLLLLAPTLLVWRWNWLGVWLGALTLWIEIVVLLLIDRRDIGLLLTNDYRMIAVSGLLGVLYCLFVIGCKSWYKTFLKSER
jgi:hypothetical protein